MVEVCHPISGAADDGKRKLASGLHLLLSQCSLRCRFKLASRAGMTRRRS